METIKYEIEATEEGYTEKVYVDGKLIAEWKQGIPEKHDFYNGILERKSGQSLDDLLESNEFRDANPDLDDLYDELPSFLGMSLVSHISSWK